jgi:excisionase family DNA binding protein
MEKLVNVKEAADVLSCSEAAVRKWLYQRRLPRVKVGRLTRIRQSDLQGLLAHGLPRADGAGRKLSRGRRSA